jgi:peptide/nickel transport system substrate-binding protein
MANKITRRNFLKASAFTVLGAALQACAAPTPVVVKETVVVEKPVEKIVKETVTVKETVPVKETVLVEKTVQVEKVVTATPAPMTFKEAPELAALVAAGKLPPVAERVSLEPLVLKPPIEIGKYGGTWRQLHLGSTDKMQNYYKVDEFFGKFLPDGSIVPNAAKSWEFNKDVTQMTINLRKGLKFSDGKPLTTADVMFWWEDCILNDELTPSKPAWLKVAGKMAEVKKLDDYAFTITFASPYGSVVEQMPVQMAGGNGYWYQAAYLKQFHPKYAVKAELDSKIAAASYQNWMQLFGSKVDRANSPGTPNISAWNPTDTVDKPIQIWERNPYFWKVDTAGNQLPYLNEIRRFLTPDSQALLLKAIAGEADFESRRIEGVANYPVAMANREKGNYRVVMEDNAGSNIGTLFFNFFHPDPVLKKLFNDKNFRHAISMGIDREEVNQITQKGVCPLSAATVAIGSAWYDEKFGTANPWIKYDVAAANKLLDGLGLDKKDSEGFRLRSDGKRLSLVNLVFSSDPALFPNVAFWEIVKPQLVKIGVEVIIKPTERELWMQRMLALDFDLGVYIFNVGHATQTPLQQRQFAPVTQGSTYWGMQWGLWYETSGKQGEEPPATVKKCQQLYDQAVAEPDTAKRIALVKEALTIHAEETFVVGLLNESPQARWEIVHNTVGNVGDRIYGSNSLAMYSCLMFKKS